jgi:hypothetical protein
MELAVTHGNTLTSNITHTPALQAINAGLDRSSSNLPVIISLENHTEDDAYQNQLVSELEGVLGERLVKGELKHDGLNPTLADFQKRIVCMVRRDLPFVSVRI